MIHAYNIYGYKAGTEQIMFSRQGERNLNSLEDYKKAYPGLDWIITPY